MEIKSITFKNFKSYGNNIQTLNLNKNGDLIILTGYNGAGKTSISDAIDYAIYGKVRGKKKKNIPNAKLINRFNQSASMYIELDFDIKDINYKIIRGQKPNKLELEDSKTGIHDAAKTNINNDIENLVGLDFNSFKSFVSMSISNFQNFIILSPEDKRKILDKLFNLNIINDLNKLLKELKSDNNKTIQSLNDSISLMDESIYTIEDTINIIKQSNDNKIDEEIETFTNLILTKKDEFIKIKDNYLQKKDVVEKAKSKINEIEKKINKSKWHIQSLNEKLKLYENEQCPTCKTKLDGSEHLNIKSELEHEKNNYLVILDKLNISYDKIKTKLDELVVLENKYQHQYITLTSELKQLKNNLEKSTSEKNKIKNLSELEQLYEKITQQQQKKDKIEENLNESNVDDLVYKKLGELLSEDGIKKTIIKKMLPILNMHLNDSLSFLGLEFQVNIDENFNAVVTSMGEEIDTETLSEGETKKINVCLMIAYSKMIRVKKNVNILFLDEVFSGIDIEGIYKMIGLLKDFSKKWKINIFLVHHSSLNTEHFDRHIHISKKTTSFIT